MTIFLLCIIFCCYLPQLLAAMMFFVAILWTWHVWDATFAQASSMLVVFQWVKHVTHEKHRRLGFFLYPLAKLADAMSSCWSRLWTGSAQKDLERIQKEMEKDEFDQSMCPICLECLVQKNRFYVFSVH